MKVLVVGAGLGGLSAAAHLLERGHQVQVVEREGMPGGRAGVVAEHGYRLDTGPTVLTMPDLLARAFAAAGADMSDFVTLRPVDPMYRAVFADGTELRVWHGRERMREEISELSRPGRRRRLRPLLRVARALLRRSRCRTSSTPTTTRCSIWPDRRGRPGAWPGWAGSAGSGKVVASYFRDERLRRMFSFQSMYAGLAPYEALALYAVITYMDAVEGVFVPEGGMHMQPPGWPPRSRRPERSCATTRR